MQIFLTESPFICKLNVECLKSCNDPTFIILIDTKKHMGGKQQQLVSKFNLIAAINHDNGRPQL